MTRFERFAYATVVVALLVAWFGLARGNDALRSRAPSAQVAGGAR
ncbi:MAG: hypothetical protein RIT45_2913 [Pseudomonadota bacterium]|jgi:hypothetical protein